MKEAIEVGDLRSAQLWLAMGKTHKKHQESMEPTMDDETLDEVGDVVALDEMNALMIVAGVEGVGDRKAARERKRSERSGISGSFGGDGDQAR